MKGAEYPSNKIVEIVEKLRHKCSLPQQQGQCGCGYFESYNNGKCISCRRRQEIRS